MDFSIPISLNSSRSRTFVITSYLLAVCSVAAALALIHWLHLPPVFFPAIILSAWYGGTGPGLFAVALSILGVSWNSSVDFTSLSGSIYLAIFLATAAAIAWGTGRHRDSDETLTLLRSLLDQTNDVIEVVDPDKGQFLEVNQKACSDHGYTREEYLRLRVQDINPVAAARSWQDIQRELRDSRSRVFETQHRRKDGSIFPVEVHLTQIRLKRDYLLAMVRDISERKRAEEKLE